MVTTMKQLGGVFLDRSGNTPGNTVPGGCYEPDNLSDTCPIVRLTTDLTDGQHPFRCLSGVRCPAIRRKIQGRWFSDRRPFT
jgi:hypothetical protein